jgi:hypothetical protein
MKKYKTFLELQQIAFFVFIRRWMDCVISEVQKIEYKVENSTLHINGYDSSDRLRIGSRIDIVDYNSNEKLILIKYGRSGGITYCKSNLSFSDSEMLYNMMLYKLI